MGRPMTSIPRDRRPDSTLAMLREGYAFISNRCRELQTDMFETRLMLSRVICTMGEEAAAMFYQPGRFTRRHAMPQTALMLLQDNGSAQQLDGEAHRHRKRMLLSLTGGERVQKLVADFEEAWQARIAIWADMNEVVLHDEVEQILCGAVCQWAGVPLTEAAVLQRTREFSAMIDGAGAIGPRSWKGMLLRARTEEWVRSIIDGIRARHMIVPDDSPAHVIATSCDVEGKPLDSQVAAVELINLLRPTVAVARYVTFAALALYQYPEYRERIRAVDGDYLEWFVQEVRRFYPFFPSVAGRVREPFTWRGIRFAEGAWVMLDIYGTNHDPRSWDSPLSFRPERFRNGRHNVHSFIPQGGGDVEGGHRCAGERLTVQLVKSAVSLLVRVMEYDVPAQDLRVDLARIPAIPKSRFVISNVRRVSEFDQEARVLRSSESRAGLSALP